VGYGHGISASEKDKKITKEKAEEYLREDMNKWEAVVSRYVDVPLSQEQYDALCSFTHNIGRNGFVVDNTLLKKLNKGDYSGAAEEFGRWVNVTVNGKKVPSEGLIQRRAAERKMFVSD